MPSQESNPEPRPAESQPFDPSQRLEQDDDNVAVNGQGPRPEPLAGVPEAAEPKTGRWSEPELERLREMYGLRSEALIGRSLGRSVEAVREMAKHLFPGGERRGPWSAEEVERLKLYLGVSPENLIARIFGRPTEDVQRQIEALDDQLAVRDLSTEEVQRLKKFYGTRRDEDLARIFSCTVGVIETTAEKYRLAKDKAFVRKLKGHASTRMPRWSAPELELLEQLYPVTANLEIARRLKRSVKSVVSKAHHLGLRKNAERLREMGRQNVSRRYGSN